MKYDMKSLYILACCFLLGFSVYGCGLKKKDNDKPASVLAEEGMTFFEDERYAKAIESFQQLKDWYPFDELAVLAEQKIPESHYRMEEYEDAVFGFSEFERLHPTHPDLPNILYLMGMCYFDRIDTVDRDPTFAKTAMETFKRLNDRFPDSAERYELNKKMHECREHLAAHEMYVGKYYFKTKHYPSALGRFESVLEVYPDIEAVSSEAAELAAQCRAHIDASETENQD